MILSILLIYLILMCWYSYSWIRRNLNFGIYNNFQLLFNFSVVVGFFIFFVFFLRVLVLFQETKVFDINKMNLKLSSFLIIFLIIIFIISLRRLVFFVFKVVWFKLHYFLLSPFNLRTFTIYGKFHLKYIYTPGYKGYKIFKWLNILAVILMFFFIFNDFVLNNGVLNLSLWYLRYYSLIKLIYFGCEFIHNKQKLILDYYNCNLMYSGIIDQNPFHANMDPNHRAMMNEAAKYKYGVIMENNFYFFEKKINIAEIDFFKNYSVHQEFIQHYWDLKNKGEL